MFIARDLIQTDTAKEKSRSTDSSSNDCCLFFVLFFLIFFFISYFVLEEIVSNEKTIATSDLEILRVFGFSWLVFPFHTNAPWENKTNKRKINRMSSQFKHPFFESIEHEC